MVYIMSKNNFSNIYDDDNIPEIDLPKDNITSQTTNRIADCKKNSTTNCNNSTSKNTSKPNYNVEPLPESSRPRKDGPGGA